MRRINVKARTLTSIPQDSYVELLRDTKAGFDNSKPQYTRASLIGGVSLAAEGAGISDGSGALVYSSVKREGDFVKTTIFVDLTDLYSSTTLNDIIGTKGADLAANGTFATDVSWTGDAATGTNWTIAGGVATLDASQVAITNYVNTGGAYLEVGATYELSFDVATFTAGTVTPVVGADVGTARGSAATFVERFVATAPDKLTFRASADFNGTIDNAVLQKVSPAYIAQLTTAVNGTLFRGEVTCLETPAGGVDDIDFYSAVEATGLFDTLVTDLDETVVRANAGSWTGAINTKIALTAFPANGEYLYLAGGDSGTAAKYTAGQFLFEFWGV